MPERNPDLYQLIWGYMASVFSQNKEAITMAFFSGIMAIAKACKTGKFSRFWAGLFEMILCSTIAASLFPLMKWLELPPEVGSFIAVAIGWFGSDIVMGIIINIVRLHSGVKLPHIINYTANEKESKDAGKE